MKTCKQWVAVAAALSVLCVTLTCSVGEQSVTDYAREQLMQTDRDEDGVEQYIEELFGTSDATEDTDGDGVPDHTEIFELSTDPLVVDGDTDSDGDTLTNLQELELGTSPDKRDTDADGLTDGEEIASAANPLVYDTDADGVGDGYEAQLGTDPCVAQSTFDIARTCEGEGAPTVQMTLGGKQVESLRVEPTVQDRLFPKEMPGAVSEAYDVMVDGTFENATVSFEVSSASVEPTICYFNEATQTLEPIVTSVEDGVAAAAITQAGTYILLDRTVYESSFVWVDRFGLSSAYVGPQVIFVIDDSASMAITDPDAQRLEVTRDLIDRLPVDCGIGVVRFSDEAMVLTALTADREAAKACLTTEQFVSEGTTAFYAGVQAAHGLYDTENERMQKVMIVLSDGQPTDDSLRDEAVAQMKAQSIQAYTVALGGAFFGAHRVLEDYTEAVGGTYYTASTANELTVVYDTLAERIQLDDDTDGDGIPDYYEDHAVAFNGVRIELDKTKADTDGDGVPDGEEVKVEPIYSEDGTQLYVKGTLLSDPTLEDTDGDGIPDAEDEVPYDNTFIATMTTEYATATMALEMDYTQFLADNTVYNPALSEVSSLLAAMAYEKSSVLICNSLKETSAGLEELTDVLSYFGMQNTQSYSLNTDYTDIHVSEVIVGYRNVCADGALRTVLAVVVRGTNGTIEEWSSNCDIGDINGDTPDDDWVNTDNHKGFDVAATRIAAFVDRYIEENGLYREHLAYWVTGHSRGAAIANILGANLEDAGKTAFTYTFAAPNTTLAEDAASYQTIFNIINTDDFVPCLPLAAWGYTCYGSSTNGVSIREDYEAAWENYTGIWDYNSDANNMDTCISTIGGILEKGSDPRVDCYKYTCSCHGDGSNDTITITNSGMSESSREKAIAKIPANALPTCIITRYDGGLLGGWDFDVCQSPAYFMQLLAAYMGGAISEYRFAVELNIADRYESAKSALVEVGISGVAHPHYPETYCLLADVLTAEAFV